MNIGKVIYLERKKQGIKQKELASKVNITPSYLSQIEHEKKSPNLSTIELLANELSIPLPILLFLSIEDTDISKDKVDRYRLIKEPITALLRTLV